jgi:phage terminase small subunit
VPGRSSADKAAEVMVKNPSVQIAREAGRSMRAWCSALGFVPDARNRIDIHRLPASAFHDDTDLD